MPTVSMDDWRAVAPPAQRAYLAQTTVLGEMLLDDEGVPGWHSLQELRDAHIDLADNWPTVQWPALCGPRGLEVSRFVPSVNELRMAPQDLNVLAYSHELAHALAPQHGHEPRWANQHLEVLRVLAERDPIYAEAHNLMNGHYVIMEVV